MKREVGIFSFGYWGWGNGVPELRRRFLKHNKDTRGRGIVWVDIRVRRSARAEGFRERNPERLLGKRSYKWINAFGNENILWGIGGIKIKDYKAGFEELCKVIEQARKDGNDLILFCACELVSRCHRNTVMKWLRKQKITGAKVYGEYPANIKP